MNDERPRWPNGFPKYRVLCFVLALGCAGFIVRAHVRFLPALQRFYLKTYVAEDLRSRLPRFTLHPGSPESRKRYPVAFVGTFVATDQLLDRPTGVLSVKRLALNPAGFNEWLRHNIYGGQSLPQLFRWSLGAAGFCLLFFVAIGTALDREATNEARNGRVLRGAALMTIRRFNWQTRGDGISFKLREPNPILRTLLPAPRVRIRRDRESHHIQTFGVTGSGKTTLLRQAAYQIEERGETAIIFDPDREFIREFYNESRGDLVLNPKDDRCPYWPISEECDDEPTAFPIAMGLFPDEPTLLKFFLDHTRAITSYLLPTYKPTTAEMAYWMAHPGEIDKRVKGTEHEHTLTANAAGQRAGILGSMNTAGRALRMMPVDATGRRTWTVREWAKARKGWIFITSTPDTLDAVRPLQSLWLDMLILALQSGERKAGQTRCWMILDELASLNALPQLHSALTRNRKSDNPIILGYQGISQLDHLYGKRAKTIVSQPYTNLILRTSEPEAAAHLSDLIGKAQLERVNESRPAHWWGHNRHSYSSQRVFDPVVMAAQIQGLPDLSGYLVQQNKVVPIEFEPIPRLERARGLIERVIPSVPCAEVDDSNAPSAVPDQTQGNGYGMFV